MGNPPDVPHVPGQSRVHLAAATLMGLFVIFVSAMVMYYINPTGAAGAEIWKSCVTTVPPIVTLILGYFFGQATRA